MKIRMWLYLNGPGTRIRFAATGRKSGRFERLHLTGIQIQQNVSSARI